MSEKVHEDSGGWGCENYGDAISRELLVEEFARKARKVEMETFKKHWVCEKSPI